MPAARRRGRTRSRRPGPRRPSDSWIATRSRRGWHSPARPRSRPAAERSGATPLASSATACAASRRRARDRDERAAGRPARPPPPAPRHRRPAPLHACPQVDSRPASGAQKPFTSVLAPIHLPSRTTSVLIAPTRRASGSTSSTARHQRNLVRRRDARARARRSRGRTRAKSSALARLERHVDRVQTERGEPGVVHRRRERMHRRADRRRRRAPRRAWTRRNRNSRASRSAPASVRARRRRRHRSSDSAAARRARVSGRRRRPWRSSTCARLVVRSTSCELEQRQRLGERCEPRWPS